MGATYLISAGTRAEVLVRQIELLDTQRAGLLLIIVDELILLRPRHGLDVLVLMDEEFGGVNGS